MWKHDSFSSYQLGEKNEKKDQRNEKSDLRQFWKGQQVKNELQPRDLVSILFQRWR